MAWIRCNACVGSGKILGGGMMQRDCWDCDGRGKVEVDEKYQASIAKIKGDSNLSDKDAKQLLDDEVSKLKKNAKGKN